MIPRSGGPDITRAARDARVGAAVALREGGGAHGRVLPVVAWLRSYGAASVSAAIAHGRRRPALLGRRSLSPLGRTPSIAPGSGSPSATTRRGAAARGGDRWRLRLRRRVQSARPVVGARGPARRRPLPPSIGRSTQNPRYVEAHLNRGVLLNGLGRTEEAAEVRLPWPRSSGSRTRPGYPTMVGESPGQRARRCSPTSTARPGRLDEALPNTGGRWSCARRTWISDLALARALLDAQRSRSPPTSSIEVLAAQPFWSSAVAARAGRLFSGAVDTASGMWDRAAEANPDDRRRGLSFNASARRAATVDGAP